MMSLTRRSLLTRGSAAVGGLVAYAALGPLPIAFADRECTYGRKIGNKRGCNRGYGNISCNYSHVCRSSPNDDWYGCCTARCPSYCGNCIPQYFQVRVTVCNWGRCSCETLNI